MRNVTPECLLCIIEDQLEVTGNGQTRQKAFIMKYKMVKALYEPDVA